MARGKIPLRLAALVAGLWLTLGHAAEAPLTVFAAASTTDALSEIGARYEAAGGGAARLVFASSATLARQIADGAPADIFLSASAEWADDLAGRKALVAVRVIAP